MNTNYFMLFAIHFYSRKPVQKIKPFTTFSSAEKYFHYFVCLSILQFRCMDKAGEVILFKEESFIVIGICMKIHRTLGRGFKEVVYKDALEFELSKAGIKYKREAGYVIQYGGWILPHMFIADFVIYDSILLEVKSTFQFQSQHFAQTLNYLKASKIKLGILINFGEGSLRYKRIVCS